jgi:hypothetical protein
MIDAKEDQNLECPNDSAKFASSNHVWLSRIMHMETDPLNRV